MITLTFYRNGCCPDQWHLTYQLQLFFSLFTLLLPVNMVLTNSISKILLILNRVTCSIRGVERATGRASWNNSSPYLIRGDNMRIFQPHRKFSDIFIVEFKSAISIDKWKINKTKITYSFSSCANDSKGASVPDVNIIEPTSILENSSIAIPGWKHHQLSVLDGLPGINK